MTYKLHKTVIGENAVTKTNENGSIFSFILGLGNPEELVFKKDLADGADLQDAEGKPVYQGIDTSFLVATLTASIKELKAIVDAQAARIAALESK